MRSLLRILARVEDWIVILSFGVIVIVTFVNIATRYLAQTSLAFTEEITINLLVVLTMFGAAAALRLHAHLGFTFIVDHAKPAGRRILVIAATVMIVAFLLVLVVYGGEMLFHQAGRGRSTPSLGIPQWLFTLSIPLAALLGILHAIVAAGQTLRGFTGQEAEVAAALTAAGIDDDETAGAGRGSALNGGEDAR